MKVDVERLRQLCAKKLTANQIAARLGIDPDSVRRVCRRHGITIVAAPRSGTDIAVASPS